MTVGNKLENVPVNFMYNTTAVNRYYLGKLKEFTSIFDEAHN